MLMNTSCKRILIPPTLTCLTYALFSTPVFSLESDSYRSSISTDVTPIVLAQQPGEPTSRSCSAIGAHVPESCWNNVTWQEIGRLPGVWPMINSEEIVSIGQNTIVRNGNSVNYDVHSSHEGYIRYSANCQAQSISVIRIANALGGYSTNFLDWFYVPSTVLIDGKTYRAPGRTALEIACSQ